MMKFFPILLICAAVVAFTPAQAQGRRSKRTATAPAPAAAPAAPAGAASSATAEAPKSGIRFVICSPSGTTLPSPLYVRSGKTFKAISIGSRTPSERVQPVGGAIDFWDKNPGATAEGDKKPAAASAKVPEPLFSVAVKADVASKAVCILTPAKDLKKIDTTFLNEKDFPKKGLHIINLTSYPLQIITSETGTFKDKKESKIGVRLPEDYTCSKNSWSLKGNKGQKMGFILSYMDKGAKEYKRIKASTFVISDRQSLINLVVTDPTRNAPKLMSIQLAEEKKDN